MNPYKTKTPIEQYFDSFDLFTLLNEQTTVPEVIDDAACSESNEL